MLNRPYTTTFQREFDRAAYNEEALLQVYKLTRNFIASLYLGAPVPRAELEFQEGDTPRDAYLEWVRQWKIAYANLSSLIRFMRSCRRTVHFDVAALQKMLPAARLKLRKPELRVDQLRYIIECMYLRHEERLRETAQVMLNARYNAKLASLGSKKAIAADSKPDR